MQRSSWPSWAWPAAVIVGASLLLAHARRFDFVCDDAYIAFRYAKHLALFGSPVYNLGERVEGYTSFVWVLLGALGLRAGLAIPALVLGLGAISALVLMSGVHLLWNGISAIPRWPSITAMGLVAMTAPIAVWTLGGLETSLFAGLLVVACALVASAANGDTNKATAAGAVLALATLTRPEGAAALVTALATLAVLRRKQEGVLGTLAALLFGYLFIVVPHLVWRRSYYGDWLPNTYYAKIGAAPAEMRAMGFAYLRLWAGDFTWSAAILGLAVIAPAPRALPHESQEARARRLASLWMLRLNTLAIVAFAVWAGGDFLGAHRFLVPALPLAILLAVAAVVQWSMVVPAVVAGRRRWLFAGLAATLLIAYASQQHRLWTVFEEGSTVDDPPAGLESIRDTRRYALRWAALGRWIAERARPGDWMAEGAAGASPFYAGINNLDPYGINDRYVARHGEHLGKKPGHQRYATRNYVAERRPVFLFYALSRIHERPEPFGRDGDWERRGYISIRVKVDERYGRETPFYVEFRMPRERALALRGDPTVTINEDEL